MRLSAFLGFAALTSAAVARAQIVQADASLPYAFHGWNTLGYSAQIGCFFAEHHLLGLEWTYFDSTVTNVYPAVGALHVAQQIQTFQATYRYSFPLVHSKNAGVFAPLEFYLGAGAGLGCVRQRLPNTGAVLSAFGAPLAAENTEMSGELAAGIQFKVGAHFGIKVGYRYIDSFNNVRQFGADTNTDTKAFEIGAVSKF